MPGHVTFNVAPRYTPGSPAQVDERIARRVAEEEKVGYGRSLAGVYGQKELWRAELFGNAGIVEARWEQVRPSGWLVQDLLTGEMFFRYATRDPKGPTVAQRTKARQLVAAWQSRTLVDWTESREATV